MNDLPIPSIYTAILAQARMAPHEVAVIRPNEKITYRRFCQDIDLVSRLLQAEKLPAGSRVGIVANGVYSHWLASIALSRLGLLACSCPTANLDVLRPTAVITDFALEHPGARVIHMTKDWLAADAATLPPVADESLSPDSHARIVMSSGTTGVPKLAMFTARLLDERLRTISIAYGLSPKSRTLCLMGLNSVGGFVWPVGTWMAGGAVQLTPPRADKPLAQLLREKPNVLFASTAQLEQLVESLPAEFTPQPELVTYVAGSALPRALNRKARIRLGQSLVMVYGSTEVGTVTLAPAAHVEVKPGLTGYVFPPAQVQIVDENGQCLAPGASGEVRTRYVGQAMLYLDDPEATAQAFRDGWFHPGDLGVLGANGDLYIKGRLRELMNFGGVKVTPEAIDDALAGAPGVVELAAFAAIDARGKEWPQVAVVAAPGFEEDELRRRAAASFPSLPPLKVVVVDRLPRNEMGKVLRLELGAKHPAA